MTEDPNARTTAQIPTTEEQHVTEPDTTELPPTERGVTEPDTTGPDATGPDASGPDITGPDITGPDTTEPDTTEQAVTQRAEAQPDLTEQLLASPAEPPPVGPMTPARRGPSVPTIVWGLLFGLIAAFVMIGQTTDVDLNLEVTGPLALLAAGVVLVVWGVAGLGRSRRTL